MKKLFIHIGTQKTGTSVLQEFCSINRNALIGQDVNYVLTGRGPSGKAAEHAHHVLAHHWLPGWLSEGLPEGRTEKVWSDFKERLLASPHEKTVISSEHFYKAATVKPEIIRGIRNDLPDVQIEIIVYFRRPDQFAQSNWAHNIKTVRDFRQSLSNYIQTDAVKSLLSYEANLKAWQDVFGPENVKVRIYDRKLFRNGDIIDDFLDILGCERHPDMKPVGEVNVSLSPYVLDFLHDLDRTKIDRYSLFVSTLERYAEKYIFPSTMKDYSALTDDLANELLDRFGEEYAAVAKYAMEGDLDIDALRPAGNRTSKSSVDSATKALAMELWHPVQR
nr:hypothetical protein [uncultured Hyphomonas sp.]